MADGGTTLSLADERERRAGGAPLRTVLYLLLEADRPLAGGARHVLVDVDLVRLGRASSRGAVRTHEGAERTLRLTLPDRWMSGTHARISKVLGQWVLEDEGSKNGTVVNGQTERRVVLEDGDLIEIGHSILLFRDLVPVEPSAPVDIDGETDPRGDVAGLRTLIPSQHASFAALAQVAGSNVSVLLAGESGTGKEVVARAVHTVSRRTGAFVAVNSGALPENLVETELFGYKKGAFSGAGEDRAGLVRSADGGTLFLDEIGDLPPQSQAALLRVLQEREVVPIGGTRPVPVDFRLIAATHRDLEHLVAEGKFRNDLHARLTGFSLTLPALRDRREDLGILIAALLAKAGATPETTFTIEAARALVACEWAQNVRELEKVLATAIVLARGVPVGLEHLPAALREPPRPATAPAEPVLSEADQKRKAELEALLVQHGGNISAIARSSGKARMQIQRWLKRFGLDPERYRR